MNQQQYVDLLKSSLLTATKKAVFDYIVGRIPWLGSALFSSITSMVINTVLKIAIEQTEMAAFFWYIDLRTAAQGKDFEKAALANQIAQMNGTPDEKKKAEQNLINAFRAFAKFSN
jgi:hypothetical protein